MPGDSGFYTHVMEMLKPVGGISGRAMFGGYGIFYEGAMFALISGAALYLKADNTNLPRFSEAGSRRFQRMPYYEVPVEVMENLPLLLEWAEDSIRVGHSTGKKKSKK